MNKLTLGFVYLIYVGIMLLMVACLFAHAAVVQPENQGNVGDVLVYSGQQGAVSKGQWVSPDLLKDGKDGQDGRDGNDGVNGLDGKDGRDLTRELRMEGQIELVIVDEKHFTASKYFVYDVGAGRGSAIGFKVTFKLGESYLERQINDLKRMLKNNRR